MCSCLALRQCTTHSACRWACCTGVCFPAGLDAPGCCMPPAVWPPAQTGSCSGDAPPLHMGWTSRGVLVFSARTFHRTLSVRAGGQTPHMTSWGLSAQLWWDLWCGHACSWRPWRRAPPLPPPECMQGHCSSLQRQLCHRRQHTSAVCPMLLRRPSVLCCLPADAEP